MKLKSFLAALVVALSLGAPALGVTASNPQGDKSPMAPVRLVQPNGHERGYGLGLATAADRFAIAITVIEAATSGDTVELGSSSYAATASVTIPAGVTVRGGGATWTATGLTNPAFVIAADDVTLDGITIASNTSAVGCYNGGTPVSATGFVLRNVTGTCSDAQGNGAAWVDTELTFAAQNHLVGEIVDCKFTGASGSSAGYGIVACLDSTSILTIRNTDAFGGTDGGLFTGDIGAEVHATGGYWSSTIDGITSGGVSLYLNNLKARGGIGGGGGSNGDIYGDDGQVYISHCDFRTAEGHVNFVDDSSYQRNALGLAIGSDVQGYDADLATWAGVTPGTGVATAAAINVGSAGSLVVNGGALGTPGSGNLASCTGLPISTGVSGLGAGTAAALAIAPNVAGGIQLYNSGNLRTGVGNNLVLDKGLGAGVFMAATAEGTFSTSGFSGPNVSGFQTAAHFKTLTETTETSFVQIPVASGTQNGGTCWYTVEADDGTDYQSVSGSFNFSIVNKGGTETCTIGTVSTEATAASSGTLTGTFASSTSPTNAVNLQANWTSSLTQNATRFKIFWRVVTNKPPATTMTSQ